MENQKIANYIFVGMICVGTAVGLYIGKLPVGAVVGVGLGFLAKAIYLNSKK